MGTRIITPATLLPVSIAQARHVCRIDVTGDSAYDTAIEDQLTLEIQAAMALCVQLTGRSVMPQACELLLDAFPYEGDIELLYPRIISVDSFTYINAQTGTPTAINALNYTIDNRTDYEAWVLPKVDYVWPEIADVANAVKISYTAGYENAASVPADVKKWILSVVKFNYDGGAGGELPDDFNKVYLNSFNANLHKR
jgi:uncharacterized phiE125 gp8 family phage protein